MNTTHFFNTTHLTGQELVDAAAKASKQAAEILQLFVVKYPNKKMTPRDVWRRIGKKYELTSVRRTITTYTKAGILKCDRENKVRESSGAVNYTWYFEPKNVVSQN